MLPAMLEGEVSSLPGRKRTLPRACGYRWRRYRHASVGPPQCWQRTGSAHKRDAGIAALGGSRRLGEGDEAAARHGQARTRTGRRADYTHRPMTEEPDAIGRPFAFLCENNYLTLNLFRAAPRRAGLGPMTRPTTRPTLPTKTRAVATTSATSPVAVRTGSPNREPTGQVPAIKESPR